MSERLSDDDVRAVIQEAQSEASRFTKAHLEQIGGDQMPCGFAWVKIKPARGQFVKVMKDIGLGHTDEYAGGYTVWNPSGNNCQNVDAKEKGARAFAAVLVKHGVNATAGSRWD